MKRDDLYFDLDETLIYGFWLGAENSSSFDRPKDAKVIRLNDGNYEIRPIPNLVPILAEARSLFKRVKILTTATFDYANSINLAFQLGFKEEEIFARGMYERSESYDPEGILIDNYYWYENNSIRGKCRFLGIGEKQLFHWPAFGGREKEGLKQLQAWEEFKEKFT